ncbi:MAG: hypothetical protein JO314_13110 [Acidobacteria bacterium]|nr:hypothetical protein [Acidobacteriota bacterium]
MKAIYSIVALCALALLLAGCGMMGGANTAANANANANANSAATTNTASNAAPSNAASNANSNTNANANVAKTDSGPKRISFGKGADWASETISLAGGQSKQFVVGGADVQYLTVDPSSPDVKILMVTKKNATVETEGASLAVHLGAKGDYVFEVRNPGSKEVKTSIKVQIINEGD